MDSRAFTVAKVAALAASLPLLFFKKPWTPYLLAVNVGVAAALALRKKYWVNAAVGAALAAWAALRLNDRVRVPTAAAFVLAYVAWNVYFSEVVLDMKQGNNGLATAAAANLLPALLFALALAAGRGAFDAVWLFALARAVLLLFYYAHLADARGCHARALAQLLAAR